MNWRDFFEFVSCEIDRKEQQLNIESALQWSEEWPLKFWKISTEFLLELFIIKSHIQMRRFPPKIVSFGDGKRWPLSDDRFRILSLVVDDRCMIYSQTVFDNEEVKMSWFFILLKRRKFVLFFMHSIVPIQSGEVKREKESCCQMRIKPSIFFLLLSHVYWRKNRILFVKTRLVILSFRLAFLVST